MNLAYPRQMVTLGDHLRKVRLDQGLSQSKVARLLKVTTDTVTGWELNRHEPQTKLVNRIYTFLRYTPFSVESDSLGVQLRKARLIHGQTQKQAAREMKCDCSNIRLIEKGIRKPQARSKKKLEGYIKRAFESDSFDTNPMA